MNQVHPLSRSFQTNEILRVDVPLFIRPSPNPVDFILSTVFDAIRKFSANQNLPVILAYGKRKNSCLI